MFIRQPTIRRTLLLTIGGLTLLIALFSLYETSIAWRHLMDVHDLKRMTLVEDELFNATETLTHERRIAMTLLHNPGNIEYTQLIATLNESRQESEQSIQGALNMMEQFKFPVIKKQIEEVRTQIQKVNILRDEIDQVLQKQFVPEKTLSRRWLTESTALIQETQGIWMEFAGHFSQIDAHITLQMRFKHILSTIMEYSGRERTLFSRLIVENAAITPQEQADMLRWRGNIEQSWNICAIIAGQSGLAPAITPYLNEAKSQFLTLQDMVGDDFFLSQQQSPIHYPISIDLWFELSNNISDSLHILKDAVKKQTTAYMQAHEERARMNILVNLVLLLIALILCGFSFRVITNRVLLPVHGMVEALYSVMQGHSVSHLPDIASRDDEIGKLAEVLRAFQQNRERTHSIIEHALDGVVTANQEGIIKEWNRQAEIIFGWSREEAMGKQLAEFIIPPEHRAAHHHGMARFLTSGKANILNERIETSALHKEGYTFPIELAVTAQKMHEAYYFTAFIRDITMRKADEQALNDAANRLQAVFDTVLDGLITINDRGIMQSFNASAERIFGYRAEEVINRNVNMLMPEPYHSEHDGYLSNYLRTGQAKVIGIGREVMAKRKDGTVFPMELGVNAFTIGSERAFVGMIRDITDRKAIEAEKESLIGSLKRSNQELDDFAYIASHDLKEPLRGLHNNAKFLLEDYQDKLDGKGVNMLLRLGYLCQRMETLVNDLLYFSRLGRQELAIQKTDLNKVIRDITIMMEDVITEQNATIRIPETLPEIICDKPRLTEVFRNLITNAIKYNDKEHKHVEIGYLPAMMSRFGMENNVFYVKDNGIGIDPDFYNDIFRIFKRLNEEDDKIKGTGVGLTFVKKIIERHGGHIWLESEIGSGTTFYFTIPSKIK